MYHKLCYDNFTNSAHIQRLKDAKKFAEEKALTFQHNLTKLSNGSAVRRPAPLPRSKVDTFNKSLCLFCQEENTAQLHLVSTIEVSEKILSSSVTNNVFHCRLAGITDLIAAEGKYHRQCCVQFFRQIDKEKSVDEPNSKSECFKKLAEKIKEGIAYGHVYTLADIWKRYTELLLDTGEETSSYRNSKTRFKQRLEKELGHVIDFVPQLGKHKPQLVFRKSAISTLKRKHEELEDVSLIKDLTHGQRTISATDSNPLLSIYYAAKSVRKDIRRTPGIDVFTGISQDDCLSVVPDSLCLFLNLLLTGEDGETEDGKKDSKLQRKILGIAQDIVYVSSNGKKLTPKHVSLGMTIHQVSRSKELVNIINAAGHCISYDQVRKIDTSMANKEMDAFRQNGNIPIPKGIQKHAFVQFAADNIDIIEETPDGKGTLHATQMVAFQRQARKSPIEAIPVSEGKEKSMCVSDELHKLAQAPLTTARPTPNFNNNITPELYENDAELDEKAKLSDLTWVLSSMVDDVNQKVPFWTGFNQVVTKCSQSVTHIGYLPIINVPAHDVDTLWTVILRCLAISNKLNPGQSTVITLDEQLYCKAKELQWTNEGLCNTLVLRLGGFHIALAFMRAIGKHFADSGLVDIWTESTVFGETTAYNNIIVKCYNRAIRAHKLTFEALLRILWPQFVLWMSKNGREISDDLNSNLQSLTAKISDRKDPHDIADCYSSIIENLKLKSTLPDMEVYISTQSPTVQFWYQYIEVVSIILRFILAEREGNWFLHLSSFASMLPWFARYDHIKYFRWGTVYLADMRLMAAKHPDVYAEYISGNFCVKQSSRNFNQIPTDQALEYVNKVSKITGGLVGITRDDKARDRWCLTLNHRSQISAHTFEMYGLAVGESEIAAVECKELQQSRLQRDENDVKKIVHQLKHYKIFRHDLKSLVSLATQDVVPEDIANELLLSAVKGKQIVDQFVHERLNTSVVAFHDPIKTQKAPTMSNIYVLDKKLAGKPDKDSSRNTCQLLQRLLVSQESGREVDLTDLLTHELTPTPLSLSDSTGSLRTCDKAELGKILQTGVVRDSLPVSAVKTASIIDGQALVQAIGRPNDAKCFGDLSNAFSKSVCSKPGSRIDVLFDRYFQNSIKNAARSKRTGRNRPVRRIVDSADVPLPVNWKQFIDCAENKANLADFLSNELMAFAENQNEKEIMTSGGFSDIQKAKSSSGRDVMHLSCNHEEADTRILLHCIDTCKEGFERAVVVCRDTDVLVMLIFYMHLLPKEVWMQCGTFKARKYVAVHDIVLSDAVRKNLLAFHSITGCDTVSQFYNHGKLSTWKVYEQFPEMLEGLTEVHLSAETLRLAEEFVCRIYSPNTMEKNINDVRVKMFRKGTTDMIKLPPTKDALNLHIQRAHYQALIWRFAADPNPILTQPHDNGWQENDTTKLLKPRLTRLDPLPKTCIETISCNCKACTSAKCSCRANKLKCTPACACSDDICFNPYKPVEDDESGDDM